MELYSRGRESEGLQWPLGCGFIFFILTCSLMPPVTKSLAIPTRQKWIFNPTPNSWTLQLCEFCRSPHLHLELQWQGSAQVLLKPMERFWLATSGAEAGTRTPKQSNEFRKGFIYLLIPPYTKITFHLWLFTFSKASTYDRQLQTKPQGFGAEKQAAVLCHFYWHGDAFSDSQSSLQVLFKVHTGITAFWKLPKGQHKHWGLILAFKPRGLFMWTNLSTEQAFTGLCTDTIITHMSRIVNCPNSLAISVRTMKGKIICILQY